MKQYNAGTHLGLLLVRVGFGLYLTLAGWGKVTTEFREGFGTFYKGGFSSSSPTWLPDWFGMPYGYALPWLELIVGGMLILGLLSRFAAVVSFLILASITISQIIINDSITGVDKEIGRLTFNKTYLMGAAYFLLIFTGAGALSLDRLFFGKREPKDE